MGTLEVLFSETENRENSVLEQEVKMHFKKQNQTNTWAYCDVRKDVNLNATDFLHASSQLISPQR